MYVHVWCNDLPFAKGILIRATDSCAATTVECADTIYIVSL